jgi:hypothetical protein
MIKRDGLPITLCVAGLAFLSIRAFVPVVFLVTRMTIQRRIFESGGHMTILALDLGMLAH